MTAPPHRHVLITGAAGDIGAAMTVEMLRRGDQVTLVDQRPPADVTDLLASLADPDLSDYRSVDVTDRVAVDHLFASIDPVDVVISNAGVVASAPFLHITPHQWQHHLDVNLTGSFNIGQAAARVMVATHRPGLILITSSWVQDHPWPEIAAYSVTKAGIAMLIRSMAAELAPHQIRVNGIAPGIVAAGMARRQLQTEPQYAARAAGAVPLGVLQTPEQVAKVTAFLCSPDADYLTGTILLADGGASLHADSSAAPDNTPNGRQAWSDQSLE